jgi:uncharacterized protein (DUF3820 family)
MVLEDNSKFPFGNHRGKPMKQVPVRYLHWVWEKCDSSPDVDAVKDYILRNIEALKKEDDDLIWTGHE